MRCCLATNVPVDINRELFLQFLIATFVRLRFAIPKVKKGGQQKKAEIYKNRYFNDTVSICYPGKTK